MDPITTSALISAGSSLLGSVFGGKSKGPTLTDINDANARQEDMLFDVKMQNAKEHGIHPLVALGIPPQGGAVFGYGGQDQGPNKFDKIAEMGQGISRAAHAWMTRGEREMSKMSAELSLENQALQNDRLRSEIALLKQPGSPPGTSLYGNEADARYPSQAQMPLGLGDSAPLLRQGIDQQGDKIRVYNDQLGDNELLQAATAVGYSFPDWMRNKIRRYLLGVGKGQESKEALDAYYRERR